MSKEVCPNCIDGSGWVHDEIHEWVICADCNDDGNKSQPTNCKTCGIDFNEFPELSHSEAFCFGPDCTCYEVIGGHQPMCPSAKR